MPKDVKQKSGLILGLNAGHVRAMLPETRTGFDEE
jgi:hypothetical protein